MSAPTKVVVSEPADPDAPSFLTLPAEIRNWIYAILLSSKDNLQLAVVANGSVALVRRSSADAAAEMEYYDKLRRGFSTLNNDPPKPRRVQQDGIELLRTCRLIHYEAAPILYANTFLLHATRNKYHDTIGRHLNSAISAWLQEFGQHGRSIQKLVLDLGAIGPWSCACGDPDISAIFQKDDRYISCGALLDAIWSSDSNLTVSFVDSGPIPSFCTSGPFHYPVPPPHSCCDLGHLNQVIQQLAQDELGMKKFRKAIGEIGIFPSGLGGVFVFQTTDWQSRQGQLRSFRDYNPFFENAKFFEATENGALRFCTNKADTTPRTVLGVPPKAFKRIIEYTLDSSASYEIDLDSFRDFRDLCGVVYLDWNTHLREFDKYLLTHNFNISMTADTNANFNFSKLKRLLNVVFVADTDLLTVNQGDEGEFGVDVDYSINLHIHLGAHVSTSPPKVAHFNVIPLVVATFNANPDRHINVHTYSGNGRIKGKTISIKNLRRLVVPVLRKYVRYDHAMNPGLLCPELWMDDQGMIEVVSTGSRVLGRERDPVEEYRTLWSAWSTGYVGAKAPPVPEVDGLASSMYLYLKWITL
ncbi:hypothetical protein IQ06DRAFT_295929 [Phaeosphaeriaceae sp. SRC1lsM3a]|nr:hypothetical protein IQ06DRAFT_295929 [Stagonospora sp. SRC1lsM3a]